MKVLSIIETLGKGGAERVLVNTLPELQKIGIECEVAILFDRDDLAVELEEFGIKVHRLNLSNKWNMIEAIFKLNKILNEKNYDIIHAHLFFAIFYAGLIKILHPSIKTVSSFHNLTFSLYPPNTFWKRIRIKIESLIVNKLINKNTACSKAVAKHYEKFLSIKQVDVIYNGFPLDNIPNVINTESIELSKYFPDLKPSLIAVTPGRAHIQKGHIYLLEAIELLIENKEIDMGFFFIGDGPEFNSINSEIHSRKLEKYVVQLAAVEQKKLFEIILAADMVILPSISEGFPMVIGEAMSLSKAIISTNVSGIPELIDNDKEGLLVPSKDPKKLSESILRMCNDSILRKEMAKNANKRVINFDIKTIAKQWKKLYEGLLNEK